MDEALTTYEYDCDLHLTERRFAIGSAPDVVSCDECGAPATRTVSRLNFTSVPGGHDQTYKR